MPEAFSDFDDDLMKQAEPLSNRIGQCTRIAWGLVFGGFVVLALTSVYRLQQNVLLDLDFFGNLFEGPIGTLWALAGVLLIYVAFLGQKLQLIYQQQELRDTRAELRGQREEFEIQNNTAKQQRFENTFFQLVSLHHEIVRTMSETIRTSFGGPSRQVAGRNCFERYYYELQGSYGRHHEAENQVDVAAEMAWMEFFELYQATLGHYFRNLYHIIKFVETSNIADKRSYTNLIRAQLSMYELVLVYYNCGVGHGREKFLQLANKFDLFQNMPDEQLFDPAHKALIQV